MANKKISELVALTSPDDLDELVIVDTSAVEAKKITGANLKTYTQGTLPTQISDLNTGWINPNETWEYVSVDNPTGVIKVNANVTTKYSLGMRIKMTNGGNTIYGILTKIGTYGGDLAGYTYLTFLHEINPSTSTALYLMANSAITNNYYSNMKAPYGFPLDAAKWSIKVSVATEYNSVSSPNTGWYNIGSILINVPIGNWTLSYKGKFECDKESDTTGINVFASLSTSASSVSNTDFSISVSGLKSVQISPYLQAPVVTTTKTPFYLIEKTSVAGCDILYAISIADAPIVLLAISQYL